MLHRFVNHTETIESTCGWREPVVDEMSPRRWALFGDYLEKYRVDVDTDPNDCPYAELYSSMIDFLVLA